MGLFKKVKDILFDEEEYTEQIKITPEMRNEPVKEEKTVEKPEPKKPSILDKWKKWLRDNMEMYNE